MYGSLADLGPVARYLGGVEALAGRRDDAERHLRQALAIAVRCGLQPSVAHASFELAVLLGGRDAAGEAADHLGRARTLATDLGLAHLQRRLDALA